MCSFILMYLTRRRVNHRNNINLHIDIFMFQLSDFHDYATRGSLKNNEKLERAVILFNNITHWVQFMILGQHTPKKRAEAIVKFVDIARVSIHSNK